MYEFYAIRPATENPTLGTCMRVCKHRCDVKMFFFSRANHASTNLKKFLSSKLDKFTLFTHSFVSWSLENLYKQAV